MSRRVPVVAAFTLIELLVVIAIISLLLALLCPVFGSARSQTRETRCRTQLREYGRGFQFYFAEYRDTFPAADYGPVGDSIREPTWFQLIDRYWSSDAVNDPAVLTRQGRQLALARCPELLNAHVTNGREWTWDYAWRTLGYGYNRWWLGWNRFDESPDRYALDIRPVFWRRLATVRQASECLLVGDSVVRAIDDFPGIDGAGHYLGWAAMVTQGAGVDTRHAARSAMADVPCREPDNPVTAYYFDGRGNLGWVDGHVSARRSVDINDKWRWRRLWDPEQRRGS